MGGGIYWGLNPDPEGKDLIRVAGKKIIEEQDPGTGRKHGHLLSNPEIQLGVYIVTTRFVLGDIFHGTLRREGYQFPRLLRGKCSGNYKKSEIDLLVLAQIRLQEVSGFGPLFVGV